MSRLESNERHGVADISPWGFPPTPLVPAAMRELLGDRPAPKSLCVLAGKQLNIGDLGASVWNHIHAIDTASVQSLLNSIRSRIKNIRQLRLTVKASGSALPVDALPLSTRTSNALKYKFRNGQLPKSLTVHELLTIPNFGIRGLLEFACVLEATQSGLFEDSFEKSTAQLSENDISRDIHRFFQLLGAWASGEEQHKKLGPALPIPCDEWPEELRDLWNQLGQSDPRVLAGDKFVRFSVPALVSRWTECLSERQADILVSRVITSAKPETLEQLGERHSVSRERIRQIETQLFRVLEKLRDRTYGPVMRRARKLRGKLGTVLPVDYIGLADALDWVVADFGAEQDHALAQQLLLWLAGPYQCQDSWLVADYNVLKDSASTLLDFGVNGTFVSKEQMRMALCELGVLEVHHEAWMNHLRTFKKVDGGYLHFTGSILDKAERLLRFVNRPITAEEIVEYTGSSSVRSVRQRLIDDTRFWRINKQNEFVLAGATGYDEYTGITDEIIQELDTCGGSATVEHLVQKITSSYGVKPSSVLAYLSTPLFVRNEAGLVRVRQDEEVAIVGEISNTAGCYLTDNRWSWRAKIDHNMLRGSGSSIPNAFARELGCDLGDKVLLASRFGNVTVSWPPNSIAGATLGSVRAVLVELEAKEEDYLFVISCDSEVEFRLLRNDLVESRSGHEKLASLVGVIGPLENWNLLSPIARALLVDEQHGAALEQRIRDVLLSRGEIDLADLIEPPELSIDQYLDRIGSVLGEAN